MNTTEDKRRHGRLSNTSHGIRLSRIAVALGVASLGISAMHPAAAFTTSPRNARLFADNTAAPASNGNQQSILPEYEFHIGNDVVKITGNSPTADTHITVNGTDKLFGRLPPDEQKAILQALPSQPTPGGTGAPEANTGVPKGGGGQPPHIYGYKVYFGHDLVQIMGSDARPDTPVTVNGARKRFSQLPPDEQMVIKEIYTTRSKPDGQGTAASPGGKHQSVIDEHEFQIGHDDVKFIGIDPEPDTPVTVNGASRLFDQLPQADQDAIKEALKAQSKPGGQGPAATPGESQQTLTQYELQIGNDVVRVPDTPLKPDTLVTFNGASRRFDQLPQGEQDVIKENLKAQPKSDGQAPAASPGESQQADTQYEFQIGSDVVRVTGTSPKPDTLVTFNGTSRRFDQLPQAEQDAIKENLKAQPKSDGGDSVKTGSA